MLIEAELTMISFDVNQGVPIIFLREKSEQRPRRILPIWIGVPEAAAISWKINKEKPARPMTHDLMLNTIKKLGASVKSIVVHSLEESTFYGSIILEMNKEKIEVDSRPSDAIALALRAEVPIYVDEEVLESAELSEDDLEEMSQKSTKKILEDLDEETLDKLKV